MQFGPQSGTMFAHGLGKTNPVLWGYMMSALAEVYDWTLGDRVDVLLAQAESERELDPELGEDAAMIYMGDIYVLREQAFDVEDGWGSRHYSEDLSRDPM